MYFISGLILTGALEIRIPDDERLISPLDRGNGRGELSPGVPRLDPDDPMANAAVLRAALDHARECRSPARSFVVRQQLRTRYVRIPSRIVCELDALKAISIAQPGFGERGLAEVAAFLVARPTSDDDLELSRIVVPPFHFTRDTISFLDADLGPLGDDERLVATYHTHPDDDLSEGLLSTTDLRYMHLGHVDFHGAVGWLAAPSRGLDWTFDIVDPRDGAWNVFSHDGEKLDAIRRRCEQGPGCPLEELRLVGSPSYLLVRTYEERYADAGLR